MKTFKKLTAVVLLLFVTASVTAQSKIAAVNFKSFHFFKL